jgi:uncharacterized membrane protein YfcA
LVAGAAAGFLAGLFGVGGGVISVSVFYEIFGILGYEPEVAMPLAVGTSLAVIVPTSIMSARAHCAKSTVDMALLHLWAVPVLAGVMLLCCNSRISVQSGTELLRSASVAASSWRSSNTPQRPRPR